VEVEAKWEKVKVVHAKAIAEWTLECNCQKILGVKPKSLPPKPKRATKQSIEQGMNEYADLRSSDAQDLTDKIKRRRRGRKRMGSPSLDLTVI